MPLKGTQDLESCILSLGNTDDLKSAVETKLCEFAKSSAIAGYSEEAVMAFVHQFYERVIAKRISDWLRSTDQPGPDFIVDPIAENVIRIATMIAVRHTYRLAVSRL